MVFKKPEPIPRRTIIVTFKSYGGFCGWNKILKTLKSISEPDIREIYRGIFLLGCRASELPLLRRDQVDLESSKTQIRIRGMNVLKQKDVVFLFDEFGDPILRPDGKRKYTFKSKDGYRTFPIRKDTPLSEDFMKYVDNFSDDEILYPYSYNQIYYRIAQIEMKIPKGVRRSNWTYYRGPWWPHRIRGERACQLIRDQRYDLFRLMGWFGWTSQKMPTDYGTIQGGGLEDDREIDYV